MSTPAWFAALVFAVLVFLPQSFAFAQADMQVTMSHSPDPVTLGTATNVSYFINVRNGGPGAATGATLSVPLPAGTTFVSAVISVGTCSHAAGTVTCTIGGMAAFASVSATIVVTPTTAGTVSNTASVSANEPDPNPANNSVTNTIAILAANADLRVTMSHSPDPVALGTGQNLSFFLNVFNSGPSGATGATLTDVLDPSLTFVSATAPCTQAAGTVTCAFGDMSAFASRSVTIVVTPTNAATLSNTASVTANEPDPNPGNNSATNSFTVTPATADLRVTMSHSPDPITLGAGQNLSFFLNVFNNGPASASAVTLTDVLPAGLNFVSATAPCTQAAGTVTCPFGNLAAFGGVSAMIVVTPAAAATVSNTANVTATEPDPNPANNSATNTVTVRAANADLGVTMTHSPEPARVGQNLSYFISVTNAGPSAASNVSLSDPLPAGVNFVSATTSQGTCSQAAGTVTCAIGNMSVFAGVSVTIVVNPPAAATFNNTASVTATESDPNPANNSATNAATAVTGNPLPTDADVQVTMSHSPDPFTLGTGQFLQYSIFVRNNGPAAATNVSLTDALPAGLNFAAATVSPPTQGSCTQAAGTVTCALGTLNAFAGVTVTIFVTPTAAGTVSNTASATATQNDPNPANNSATDAVTVNAASADLRIGSMSHSPDQPTLGSDQFFQYFISVSNGGPSQAMGVTLTDTLPAGLTFVAATVSPPTQGSCSADPITGAVICNLGNLNPFAGVSVTIFVTPTADGTVSNTASVAATTSDPNPGNNSATDNATINAAGADLRVTMSHSPDPITLGAGQFLQYFISVNNSGPSPATAVSLTDTLPAGLTFAAATVSPPTQGTCTQDPATGTVTCALGNLTSFGSVSVTLFTSPTAAGTMSNTASATATEPDPNPGNNSATDGVAVNAASADMSLTMSHSPDPVRVGQSLQYFINITNGGPSAATNVTMTDTLPSSFTFAGVSLSPPTQGNCTQAAGTVTCALNTMGAGTSVSVTIFVTPTTVASVVTNTASVSASEGDPNPGNNSASNNVTVLAAAAAMPAGNAAGAPQTAPARTVAYLVNDLGPLPGGAPNPANPLGQSVGYATAANGEIHAVIYNADGRTTDLGTLGGKNSFAFGINLPGQVVGQSETANGDTHAFLYSGGAMTDLGTLGGNFSAALAIDNSGQVVGTSTLAGGYSRAFVYRAGVMTDLNNLIAADSGWVLELALGFDFAGQIVGYGSFNGEEHVFALTPAPAGAPAVTTR